MVRLLLEFTGAVSVYFDAEAAGSGDSNGNGDFNGDGDGLGSGQGQGQGQAPQFTVNANQASASLLEELGLQNEQVETREQGWFSRTSTHAKRLGEKLRNRGGSVGKAQRGEELRLLSAFRAFPLKNTKSFHGEGKSRSCFSIN